LRKNPMSDSRHSPDPRRVVSKWVLAAVEPTYRSRQWEIVRNTRAAGRPIKTAARWWFVDDPQNLGRTPGDAGTVLASLNKNAWTITVRGYNEQGEKKALEVLKGRLPFTLTKPDGLKPLEDSARDLYRKWGVRLVENYRRALSQKALERAETLFANILRLLQDRMLDEADRLLSGFEKSQEFKALGQNLPDESRRIEQQMQDIRKQVRERRESEAESQEFWEKGVAALTRASDAPDLRGRMSAIRSYVLALDQLEKTSPERAQQLRDYRERLGLDDRKF
jgi:hypothetical protein